jgi:hypothetical protein
VGDAAGTENCKSVATLATFGKFTYLDTGDVLGEPFKHLATYVYIR